LSAAKKSASRAPRAARAAAKSASASASAKGKTASPVPVHVISHTHWDRAWYSPFEVFRQRLIEMVDDLLDTLNTVKGFEYFFFDGQIVPLEDYLEVRSGRRGAIEAAARSGRLILGPHYVLPDVHLVSGEALIRNLLIGTRTTAQFARPSLVGYLPDPFGHVSQMPQILNGFGIDSFLFSRGVNPKVYALGQEFIWEAPDGKSQVLAVHQMCGYGNARALGHELSDLNFKPYEAARAIEQASSLFEKMLPRTPSRVLLFNNGIDHMHAQRTLPQAIDDINRAAAGRYRLIHSTFEKYLAAVRKSGAQFKTYRGELRGAIDHGILSGVYSARLYLKQANAWCQTLLERYAEPAWSIAAWEGYPWPGDSFTYAWKTLLKNHPHDDICGCSVDEVHRDMLTRFTHVKQVGSWLHDRALDHLLFQINLPSEEEAGTPLLVFNPLPWNRAAAVRAVINVPADMAAREDQRLELVDSSGAPAAAALARMDEPFTSDWAWGEQKRQNVRVEFLARDLPAGGYEVYFIRPASAKSAGLSGGDAAAQAALNPAPTPAETREPAADASMSAPPTPSSAITPAPGDSALRAFPRGMENELIRLTTLADGSIVITDKASGKLLARTNIFEDAGDRGDEYDFDPVTGEQPLLSDGAGLSWAIVQRNPHHLTARLEQIFYIPESLVLDRSSRAIPRTEIPLRTDVTLYAGSRRVDLRVSFINHAADHRLRIGVEAPGMAKSAWVESKFDVIERSLGAPPRHKLDTQEPKPTAPQNDWAAIETPESSVAIFNKGLPEYEVQAADGYTRYWLTIARCIGWLSRPDMTTRPGPAGPVIATPEAQCIGEQHAELSILPYEGNWEQAGIARAAQEYLTPPAVAGFFHAHRGHRGSKVLAPRHSFYEVGPAPILVSAVKQAEENPKARVMRVWNPGRRAQKATITVDRPLASARLLRLDETPIEKLEIDPKNPARVIFAIGPKQITTLELIAREPKESKVSKAPGAKLPKGRSKAKAKAAPAKSKASAKAAKAPAKTQAVRKIAPKPKPRAQRGRRG